VSFVFDPGSARCWCPQPPWNATLTLFVYKHCNSLERVMCGCCYALLMPCGSRCGCPRQGQHGL
jgi:hypothetical protein